MKAAYIFGICVWTVGVHNQEQEKEIIMLKHGILGLLNYGDMTGYEIMGVFRESLSHFWVAQTSQIYRELQVLEKNGWVQTTHVLQDNKPDKNVLSITEEGRQELLRWLAEDEGKRHVRSPLLMKTFFRGEYTIDENLEFFQKIMDSSTVFPRGKEAADTSSDIYEKQLASPQRAMFWRFTIEYGFMYEEMLRTWCQHCIEELEAVKQSLEGDEGSEAGRQNNAPKVDSET